MKAAVVSLSAATGTVTNVIVADGTADYPPDKTSILVSIPDNHPASKGWTWENINGFTNGVVAPILTPITASPLTVAIIPSTAIIVSTGAVIPTSG